MSPQVDFVCMYVLHIFFFLIISDLFSRILIYVINLQIYTRIFMEIHGDSWRILYKYIGYVFFKLL